MILTGHILDFWNLSDESSATYNSKISFLKWKGQIYIQCSKCRLTMPNDAFTLLLKWPCQLFRVACSLHKSYEGWAQLGQTFKLLCKMESFKYLKVKYSPRHISHHLLSRMQQYWWWTIPGSSFSSPLSIVMPSEQYYCFMLTASSKFSYAQSIGCRQSNPS